MVSTAPSIMVIRDLYARMLLTRIVDDYACKLQQQGLIDAVASCHGHEAAQIGSAVCIEVGRDFTLPYYRDLGVVLTIGMTPYEVFRSYLQIRHPHKAVPPAEKQPPVQHWGYHKHNTVTGPAPAATQLLHAAGIAFASKLRKAAVVTVAYCGDGVTKEPDFLESMRFATQHQLPVVFVCEHNCPPSKKFSSISCTPGIALPTSLNHHCIDGRDIVTVYTAMNAAMQHARKGHGPLLLEMHVTRSTPHLHMHQTEDDDSPTPTSLDDSGCADPLVRCRHYLQTQNAWDDEWATQLSIRITTEIESAIQDAIRDTLSAR